MITAMLPLMVAVAARIFLKETITSRTAFGFSLAIAGAVWLSLAAESSEWAPHPIFGNFLEFLAMAATVGYFILLKKLTARYSPFFLTAMQTFIGAVFYFPILFLPFTELPTTFEPTSTLAVLWLGTAVTVGAYGLYNYGLSRIPASQASTFINLIPILAVFMGWLILDETLTLQQYIASVLVFAGVFISQDRPKEG
jgi:drug/metabolite transporter (DMT)-like permease